MSVPFCLKLVITHWPSVIAFMIASSNAFSMAFLQPEKNIRMKKNKMDKDFFIHQVCASQIINHCVLLQEVIHEIFDIQWFAGNHPAQFLPRKFSAIPMNIFS